jgi:hypothetical protein
MLRSRGRLRSIARDRNVDDLARDVHVIWEPGTSHELSEELILLDRQGVADLEGSRAVVSLRLDLLDLFAMLRSREIEHRETRQVRQE